MVIKVAYYKLFDDESGIYSLQVFSDFVIKHTFLSTYVNEEKVKVWKDYLNRAIFKLLKFWKNFFTGHQPDLTNLQDHGNSSIRQLNQCLCDSDTALAEIVSYM